MSLSGSLSRQNTKWDPKTVEIRTKSVEKSLEPLICQVTTLVNHYNRQHRKGYCSKKAPQLVRDIEIATQRLVEAGESIAEDFSDMKEPMLEACSEARNAGDKMEKASHEFANDPCNPQKRNSMVRAARALLSAVTRLLCVADMADVQKILQGIEKVDEHLKNLVNISDINDFKNDFKKYGDDLFDLAKKSAQRQADLKNQIYKDEMAAARSALKNSSRLLYTASKAYITHPDTDSALENRDFAVNQLDDALATIGDVVQSYGDGTQHPFEENGSLLTLFEDILKHLDRDGESFYQKESQNDIRALVEEAIEKSTHIGETIASSNSVKEQIYAECGNTKSALSDLLDACSGPRTGNISDVESARANLQKRTVDLSKQVHNCIIGSVADSFLGSNVPLILLMEAAEAGDREEADARSVIFLDHTTKLAEVSNLACSTSGSPEKIKMVKIAAEKLEEISHQVVNASSTMTKHQHSKNAKENMYLFRDMWLEQMAVLTEAVDDITTIDDYLLVCEQRILEDTNRCVDAMQHRDITEVNRTADDIRERILRVDDMVTAEIQSKEPGPYVVNIEKCLRKIKGQDLSLFLDHIDKVVRSADGSPIDEKAFEDSARRVYQSFKHLRKSVRKRDPASGSDADSQSGHDDDDDIWIKEDIALESNEKPEVEYYLPCAKSASTLIHTLTNDQKKKINSLVEGLSGDKELLLSEVNKWEEQGNEIIVLAKRMCVIMMDLSDFTRGTGTLKTSMDVIKAVEKIAKHGSEMTELVNQVSQDCPHSHTRSDLVAYIQRIALYSHQLKLTARVKADVQIIGGEAIWTQIGHETAKSLIETARNLMNSVMLTVRACYIASTKHRANSMSSSSVAWHMTAPEKKPLIERDDGGYTTEIRYSLVV